MEAVNHIALRALTLWEDHSGVAIGKVLSKNRHSFFYSLRGWVKVHRLYITTEYYGMIHPIIDHITYPWGEHAYGKGIEPRAVIGNHHRRLGKINL